MPAKPFNKEVLSFHIPLARHVITPDTCILGTFSLIFHLPSLSPPRSNPRSRSGRRLQREMDSTKKNIKNERVSNSMETFAGKKHLEKSRNPEIDWQFSLSSASIDFLDQPRFRSALVACQAHTTLRNLEKVPRWNFTFGWQENGNRKSFLSHLNGWIHREWDASSTRSFVTCAFYSLTNITPVSIVPQPFSTGIFNVEIRVNPWRDFPAIFSIAITYLRKKEGEADVSRRWENVCQVGREILKIWNNEWMMVE